MRSGRFRNISLKNKFFFSTLGVIILLSVGIALNTRIVLVEGMTDELKQRGVAIAQSIADRGRSYIVTMDQANLVSLVFDSAHIEERRKLIAYIYILDGENRILSHTFLHPFPEELYKANQLVPESPYQISLSHFRDQTAFDIAVPIWEGIYQIGSVHVGLNKKHIDRLIERLGLIYIGIIIIIIGIFFLISHWISTYMTRPIYELTKMADEISRGNMDATAPTGNQVRCWEKMNCTKNRCPAYEFETFPCWYVDETHCSATSPCKFPQKLAHCEKCSLFKQRGTDEVRQLADSFLHMTHRLKVSQTRLMESEQKYRSLFESGPNALFVLNSDTLEILDANPMAESTYGYSKEEMIGNSFRKLGIVDDSESEECIFPVYQTGHPCSLDSKIRHYKKGGKPFYVKIHACRARYGDKDAVIIAITDITDMVEKDAQLIQASKMTTLGEMSAGIAHELNQPLNAIKMGSEYLTLMMEQGKSVTKEDASLVVSEISTQVDRASDIILRLRQFCRKSDLVKERVDINDAVREVLAILKRQMELQGINIELDLLPDLPAVYGYRNRLEQVLFNLLTNARDAIMQKKETGQSRSIAIRSFMEGQSVALTVSDTGVGIPASIRERIFEPFFTTKPVGKGMGLGLSITYGIVKEIEGDIQVESEENRGTVFKLIFPAAEPRK
jgi:histidine kinase